jgi:glycerophosphoryl diester phosphodiesterase
VNLLRGDGPPLVVGHRGAAALAPENTLASLAAAVDAGADLVEFDVGAGLTLAHSETEVPHAPASLDDALEFLAGSTAGAHVDLKLGGLERSVVDAVRRHGLERRALVSAAHARWLRAVAAAGPELALAIGYPRDRYGVSRRRWPGPAVSAASAAARAAMPLRVPSLLRLAHANVVSLHHGLVTRAVVDAAHRCGAPVLAWTVNEPGLVERLDAAGIDGIISDDPGMVARTLGTLRP